MKSQIQFNWIFVVVAGAIILLFFTGFAFKYKDLQEKKQEIIFLNNFDKALTNLQSSGFKTSTSLNLPFELNVGCNNIYINEKHETMNLFFSKNKLKDKIYIWYYPYEYPFKITEFYFLTDDSGLNIETNNVNVINELIKDMPESFKNKIKVNQGGSKRIDIQGNTEEGMVIINGKQYNYYGKGLLYGAIFSDNYACLLDEINSRFEGVINTYQNKINILQRSGCNYGLINSRLNELKLNKGYDLIGDIEDLNQGLASMDCPVVF